MKKLDRENTGMKNKLPVKVVQFGEGNFLRAFVDYIINKLNEEAGFNTGVAVVQPISSGLVNMLNEQDGLYNLFIRGVSGGKEIQQQKTISCITKAIDPYIDYEKYLALAREEELEFVISNTTEAGIAFDKKDKLKGWPHNSFPAKLTALLYARFKHFKGENSKGLTIIPCELINYNADTLKSTLFKYVDLWNLENEFVNWLEKACSFHNTLVDRIVPGYPKDDIQTYQEKLEFEDRLIVTAEVFLLWVIEGDEKLKKKIPFEKIDENILVVKDMQPYRMRKVRILNGAHTTMVPFSLLYGNKTVKETVDNDFTGGFIKEAIFDEIIPTLSLSKKELQIFAEETLDRFRNPFIKHQLASIALNSISKFKVRVLPSLLAFQKKYKQLPPRLTFAFACLIRFYKGEWEGEVLPVQDNGIIKNFFQTVWENHSYQEIAGEVLSQTEFWDKDLTKIPKLQDQIARALEELENKGIEKGFVAFTELE